MLKDNIFTFTRSPYYNEVIKGVKMVYEDDFSGPSVEELTCSLKSLSDFMAYLQQIYEEQKEIQISHPVITQENIKIEENLKSFKEHIFKLREITRTKNKNIIIDELTEGKKTVTSLFSSFDIISKISEESPKYSSIPIIHEFLRIARGVCDGKFQVKYLKKQVETLREGVSENYEELLLLKKTSLSKEEEEEILKVEASYRELLSGLDEIKKFFRNNDKKALQRGMELVKEHSGKLVASQKVLETEKEKPRTKKCFRCGNNNPLEAKFCIKCRMAMPKFKSEEVISQMSIKLEGDSIVQGDGTVMTENIYRLSQAIEDFERGRITKEELSGTIEWIESKIRRSGKQFELHKKKRPENIPKKEKALVEEMELLTQKGLGEFEEAIEDFKTAVDTDNHMLLKRALEKAVEAGDKLYKVQMIFKSATGR